MERGSGSERESNGDRLIEREIEMGRGREPRTEGMTGRRRARERVSKEERERERE